MEGCFKLLMCITKTMNCTPKYVKKVTFAKNEICTPKIEHEKQLFN